MTQSLLKKTQDSTVAGNCDSHSLFFGKAIYIDTMKWRSRYPDLRGVMEISRARTGCSWPGCACGRWGSPEPPCAMGTEPAPLGSGRPDCPGLQCPISLHLSFEKCSEGFHPHLCSLVHNDKYAFFTEAICSTMVMLHFYF